MTQFDRRRFLRQAVFGSGAIPLLGASKILSGQVAVQPRANFQPVHGRILTLSGATMVVKAVEGIRPLSLVGARIWKGGNASATQLRPGDVVWARGVPLQDGVLLVTDLWANIVNVRGRVETIVSSTRFMMRWGPFGFVSGSSSTTTVTIDARTIFFSFDGISPASPENLKSGSPIQVVGTAHDESGIHATRVFVSN
jgi:hypothetical protein